MAPDLGLCAITRPTRLECARRIRPTEQCLDRIRCFARLSVRPSTPGTWHFSAGGGGGAGGAGGGGGGGGCGGGGGSGGGGGCGGGGSTGGGGGGGGGGARPGGRLP